MQINKANNRAKIREDINTSEVGHGLVQLFNELLENRKKVVLLAIIDIVIATIIPQSFFQWALLTLGIKDIFTISDIITNAFTIPGFLLILVSTVLLGATEFKWYRMHKKDYFIDDKGNMVLKTASPYGDAHWQFEEERKDCFLMETDVDKLKEDILGIDEQGRIYGLRPDLVSLNKNALMIGAPGCGKSEAIIKNKIFQTIKRGESGFVTDSKGDLYTQTAPIARAYGYIVRVINLKPRELKNSDGCHFLKSLRGDDADANAEMLANAIIENTGDGHMDYFAINEMNLLKALLLYVAQDPALIRAKRNNLAEVFNIITSNNADSLEELFSSISDDEPAKQAFNIFNNCEPKVKGQIINGMGIRLGLMSNPYVKKICSEDEIDLVLPMKKKCLYYVVISDTDTSYKFIATLFFTLAFIEMCNYSDSLTEEQKEKQLAVNMILDEFASTGAIPNFEDKVTTVRSRKISIMIALQTIGQLENMYPEKLFQSILGSMTIKMLLRAGDEDTAQLFTTLLGNQTIRIQQKRYKRGAADIVEGPPEYQTTEGFGTRELMSVNELMELDANELVIVVAGHKPIKLQKYLSKNHTMQKEADEQGLPKIRPNRHKPKWRARMEAEQCEKEPQSRQKPQNSYQEEYEETDRTDQRRKVSRQGGTGDGNRQKPRPKPQGTVYQSRAVRSSPAYGEERTLREKTRKYDEDGYEETPIRRGRMISPQDQRGINNF